MSSPVASSTVLSALPAAVTSTTLIPVSATVSSSTGVGTPTGTVQFTVDTVAYGSPLTLNASGFAAVNLTLATGTHTICANYSGDTTFAVSFSSPCTSVLSTVTPATLALSSSTSTPFSYQTATLTGSLNGISPTSAPTALISFSDVFTSPGGAATTSVLGTAALSGTLPGGLAVGPLPVGTHVITATYPGDKTYGAATSNSVTLTVALATVSLAPASASLTATAGTAVADVITLTSTNFSGSESLSCAVSFGGSGSPGALPGCALSPAIVAFGGSGSVTSTLSLTTVRRAALGGPNFSLHRTTPSGAVRSLDGIALCGLFALCLPRRSRKAVRAIRAVLATLLLALTLTALSGCGDGTFGSSPGSSTAGTAAGPYTVTITAAGSTNVSGSTTVGLTIQ